MRCELRQTSLESFLSSLSLRPSRFQAHAEGALKRLQKKTSQPLGAKRTETASSSTLTSEVETVNGDRTCVAESQVGEEREQRRWGRAITCDVPSRPVVRTKEYSTRQNVVSARQSSVSVSSPTPPMSREPLSPQGGERPLYGNGISQLHPMSIEHPSASPSHSDCSTAWEPGLSDSSGTSACSLQEQGKEPAESLPTAAAAGGGRGSLMVREVPGRCQRDFSKARSLQDLPEAGTQSDPMLVSIEACQERRLSWPQDVLQLLECPARSMQMSDTAHCCQNGMAGSAVEEVGFLRFSPGGFSRPHPEKASSTGADSYFLGSDGFSLGIADGVGEWEWRFGINARAFADELMAGCQAALEAAPGQPPLDALEEGFKSTKSFGSSTALVASLDSSSSQLRVANLGDSALLVLRQKELDSTVGLRCAARTREQQHAFNCPFQLSLLPTPADYPELVRQGKEKLVRAIQRRPNAKVDTPQDADLYSFEVQEGDLVVLGTDGVFDNIYVHELCQLAGSALGPQESGVPTDATKLAEAICKAAFHRSTDRSARSPFGDHAKQAGLYHTGGKMDDITCVCAWVRRKV
eukprot:TRINITY_DN2862_c0_g1_i1.p1 TRINITY_DN2862_c0_g1~~TRINITY_DN2862_c0_g1_i1.p1  ORF type:complete len:580 (+),score=97.93 TRINITY_DN2862_c0_g1_i1:181-1920(+)